MLLEEIESRRKWINDVEAVFQQADEDDSGTIDYDEFLKVHEDIRLQTALKCMGVDLSKMKPSKVWEMLDFEQKGEIDVDAFASALQHFHGDAKSIDVARLMHELRCARKELKGLPQISTMVSSLYALSEQTAATAARLRSYEMLVNDDARQTLPAGSDMGGDTSQNVAVANDYPNKHTL